MHATAYSDTRIRECEELFGSGGGFQPCKRYRDQGSCAGGPSGSDQASRDKPLTYHDLTFLGGLIWPRARNKWPRKLLVRLFRAAAAALAVRALRLSQGPETALGLADLELHPAVAGLLGNIDHELSAAYSDGLGPLRTSAAIPDHGSGASGDTHIPAICICLLLA
jgi:hypothetical protein